MRVRRVGAAALLLEVDDPMAWFGELWRRRESGELHAVEIVPAAGTVLLDGVPDPQALAAALTRWPPTVGAAAGTAALVEIPVAYGGPDLGDVAARWGTTERNAVARLASTEFRVAFCGFAPGFGYLTGLPPELAVPRLPTPRPRVPAGSVGLAGRYAGIYPSASPGGWRLVGRTDATLFNVDREPPALLAPGIRVRLVEADP
jgi:KipI family sensor histidine kinase inhibitor